MKKTRWVYSKLAIVIIPLILGGCSTYGKISALPADNQKITHQNNKKTLISEKASSVSLTPKLKRVKSGARGDFILSIENRSSNHMPFSIDDISVTSHTINSDEIRLLEVFRREELIRKEKSSQKARNAWDIFGTVIHTLNAGLNADPKNLEALKKHEEQRANTQKKHQEILRGLESFVPEKTTILPGKKISGLVRIQLPKITDTSQKIMFVISLGDEEHALTFIQEKAGEN